MFVKLNNVLNFNIFCEIGKIFHEIEYYTQIWEIIRNLEKNHKIKKYSENSINVHNLRQKFVKLWKI